ncbi:hypothetical protein [Kitasatospora herbaricolor]|uniref:Uncharacterized protein n=1 Tax=Kitasatospora herbaricolor TaxID=68217 RepID=A0ABZ1W9I5_9ACTN|nr:hypothetical protein [Kitasatospora herbaricolor]
MSEASSMLVTAEIEDVMEPLTAALPGVVERLWEELRALPLGSFQYEAYRRFLGPGVIERVTEAMECDGELHLTFAMRGRLHSVRVVPAVRAGRGR